MSQRVITILALNGADVRRVLPKIAAAIKRAFA